MALITENNPDSRHTPQFKNATIPLAKEAALLTAENPEVALQIFNELSPALNITRPRSQENLTPEYRENPLISGGKTNPKKLRRLKSTALPPPNSNYITSLLSWK